MFYPFIVFLIAAVAEPQHGKVSMESPIGYPTLNRCVAQLAAVVEDTMTQHQPGTIVITHVGCVYNDVTPL